MKQSETKKSFGAAASKLAGEFLRPAVLLAFVSLSGLVVLCAPWDAETRIGHAAEATTAPKADSEKIAEIMKEQQEKKPAVQTAKAENNVSFVTLIPTFDAEKFDYILTAWSRQGMQQVGDAEGAWTMLRPGSILEAQLVKRGATPNAVTEGVTISYRMETEILPKIDPAKPMDITGAPESIGRQLTGGPSALPKPARDIAGKFKVGSDGKSFITDKIPLIPYTEKGVYQPYPLAVIEARDMQGKLLAQTRVTVPVSSSLGCKSCHGGEWRDGEEQTGISMETAKNILKVHDQKHDTNLLAKAERSEEAREQGKTGIESYGVSCVTCHNSENTRHLDLSTAVHGFHAANVKDFKGDNICISCHPGQQVFDGKSTATYFMRDVHAEKGMSCTSCHGGIEDFSLSLLNQAKKEGRERADSFISVIKPVAVASAAEITPRKAWLNQPDCQACHNYEAKPRAEGISSFNKWNVDSKDLYVNSLDGSMEMRCASCHGSPHAIYPSSNPVSANRDNIQPLQYQGVAKALGALDNCQICHAANNLPKDQNLHHPQVARSYILVSLPASLEKLRFPRVRFQHEAHAALECASCHHAGIKGGKFPAASVKEAKAQSCSMAGCHDKVVFDQASPHRNFFTAFHGPDRGCLPCHIELRAEGKVSGPTDCFSCHYDKTQLKVSNAIMK